MRNTDWMDLDGEAHLVSVMIPTFNRAELLLETLESVRAQKYRPIETIVVDDGSCDGTEERVSEWKRKYENDSFRIVYHWHVNQGLAPSRNKGVELSRGEFLQILDSDDLMHPRKLDMSVEAFGKSGCDVVVSGAVWWRDYSEIRDLLDGQPKKGTAPDPYNKGYYIMRPLWGASGPLFRRAVLAKAGRFPDERKLAEEVEFHARVKCVTRRIVYLPYILNFYRKTDFSSLSGSGHTVSKCFTSPYLEQTLRSYGVEDPAEWRQLSAYCMKSAYRASIIGEHVAFIKAMEVARRARIRSRDGKLRLLNCIPDNSLFHLMRGVGCFRRWIRT